MMQEMLGLAMDTAGDVMSLALVHARAGDSLPSLAADAPGGAQASSQLWPAIDALLSEAGWTLPTLHWVAAGIGPGAFTGVRTAVAAAQGLALGLGCPALAIDTLMLAAQQASAAHPGAVGDGEVMGVAVDARMQEVYAATYRRIHTAGHWGWQVVQAPALWRPDALLHDWHHAPPSAVCGNAQALLLEAASGGASRTLPKWLEFAPAPSRAEALAQLALWASQQPGALIDPAQLQPLYARNKVALTTAERAAQRAESMR